MINIAFSCITAFIITFLAIPSIIKVAVIKNLFDEPGGRKAHKASVPTLGGLAIFAGVVFAFTFWSAGFNLQDTQYIIAALIVMFFIGIKDDIVELPAMKKLYGQIVAAVIIVLFANIRITGLYGIFGIDQVPYWFSLLFSMYTILLIINAFNLIDGVDGLAAGIGAIAAFTYGIYFYNYNEIALCILSFSLFSSLLAFLVYNFAPANIFMGDTGSLVLGFAISVLCIRLMQVNADAAQPVLAHAPVFVLAVVLIPVFDTLRVFITRTIKGGSPFVADKTHIHHLLTNQGFSHRYAARVICFMHGLILFQVIWLQSLKQELAVILLLVFMTVVIVILKHLKAFSSFENQKHIQQEKKEISVIQQSKLGNQS